jgi:hypothetical protein
MQICAAGPSGEDTAAGSVAIICNGPSEKCHILYCTHSNAKVTGIIMNMEL